MVEVARFAEFLHRLAAGLDPDAGWYGVFAQHDPDGLRACLQGRELPPWDVVESLLSDAGAATGETADRARSLHGAAVAAWDAQFGSVPELSAALDAMRQDLHRTDQDLRDVHVALSHAAAPQEHARLTQERAWLHDDRTRLMARIGEVRDRIAAMRQDAAAASPAAAPVPQARRGGKAGRRLRGARFAGVEEAAMPAPVLPTLEAVPGAEAPGSAAEAGEPQRAPVADAAPEDGGEVAGAAPAPLRGARFAGAAGGAPARTGRADAKRAELARGAEEAAAGRRAAVATVERMVRLRAEGRTGEAYAELTAAAAGRADRLPGLLTALERAGLAADTATLLWEAGGLPPHRLAAAAAALAEAGFGQAAGQLLRQSVSRPAPDLLAMARTLQEAGHPGQLQELLLAFILTRTAAEAVTLALADPGLITPPLLAAAAHAPTSRHESVTRALRSAGLPGAA